MKEFLSHWYGVLAFVLFDVAVLTAVIAITYRWLFKRIFDLLCSIVCIAVTSPVFLVAYIRAKNMQSKCGEPKKIFKKTVLVGKKAKTVRLTEFAYEDEEGNVLGAYGEWLKRTGIYKLPRLFDVFLGRLSFVGVKPFSLADAEFVAEDDEDRFTVRAGLINPLVLKNDESVTYQEMLSSDTLYADKQSFFLDIKIFFTWAILSIRGDKKNYLGQTESVSYADYLKEQGEITQEDYDSVMEYIAENK